MEREIRQAGLDVLGDVPWGTHFCQFFQTPQDLLDVLVGYFRQGLEDNEFCMWVTSEPLGVKEAHCALQQAVPDLEERIRRGQIELLDYREWYTIGGQFDADRVLHGWVEKERAALERGYEGLRLSGNTFWLEKGDWKAFADYEAVVDRVIGSHRMLALCTYSLEKCSSFEVLDVVRNHEFALIKQEGKWKLIQSQRHRKVEQTLRASEVDWEQTFNTVPDFVAILDDQHRIVRANRPMAERLGVTTEQCIGLYCYEAVHGTAQPPEFCPHSQTCRDHREHTVEVHEPHLGGDFLVSTTPRFDAQGRFTGTVHVARNITERKRAEEEKARLASFPLLNPQPVVEVDMDGCVCFANPAAQRLFPDLQQLGRDHPWLSDWDLRAKVYREHHASLAARDVAVGERHYHQVMYYVPEVRRVRIFGEDITERIRAEMALQQSHDQLQAIYDGTLDGLLVTDIETKRFVRTNPAMCRMLGYCEEEILSMSVMEIHPPDALPAILEQFQALVDGCLPVAEGVALVAKDGTVLRADISGKCVVYGGRPCVIGFIHNVTEREHMEQ